MIFLHTKQRTVVYSKSQTMKIISKAAMDEIHPRYNDEDIRSLTFHTRMGGSLLYIRWHPILEHLGDNIKDLSIIFIFALQELNSPYGQGRGSICWIDPATIRIDK